MCMSWDKETFERIIDKCKSEERTICKHWDCPYNGCKYHEFFDEENQEYLSKGLDFDGFLPRNEEEMKECKLYYDL